MSRTVAAVWRASWRRPVADGGSLQQVLPPVVVGVRVQRLAGRRGEHVPLLHPQVTGKGSLASLLLLVQPEQLHEFLWDTDRALARLGLRSLGLLAGVDLLRAVPGLTAAPVAAAVLVAGPQAALPYADHTGIEVDATMPSVLPGQAPHSGPWILGLGVCG